MILFLDTSALLKKYFKETGSETVISLWKEASAIVTSIVAYAEGMSSILRKKREVKNKNIKPFERIIDEFRKDWTSFILVDVNRELNSLIDRLVADHPLKGFDAIHLASALLICRTVDDDFIFACYEQRLLDAAKIEGLKVVPQSL